MMILLEAIFDIRVFWTAMVSEQLSVRGHSLPLYWQRREGTLRGPKEDGV